MCTIRIRIKITLLMTLWLFAYCLWSMVDLDSVMQTSQVRDNISKTMYDYESMNRRKALYDRYGYDAVLSDSIKLNLFVHDIRHDDCKTRKYQSKLPKSSIIIIFYNERRSVLLRTVYSILQRTPFDLIQEIILVDDGSTWLDLHGPLDKFLKRYLPPEHSKVHLLRLSTRRGLMVARMVGARNASKTSEVLIFLDSHFEMMYNWLPPLLEPIALNPKACTIPSLDRFAFDSLRYQKNGEHRGYFDWFMNYQNRALRPNELAHPARNFRAYVMRGGAMAIGADSFWRLGGFDEGMQLWGGEQFEISFKIWMCGGDLTSVPCSRMAHLFRDRHTRGNKNLYGIFTFLNRNVRRLIDVWFDAEHRQYVLNHRKGAATVDPGDLNERLALKDRLQCQNFSWMMKNIMPDMKQVFPPIERLNYGTGFIRKFLKPEMCIVLDTDRKEIILKKCDNKDWRHIWTYSWRCELRVSSGDCMEVDINNRHVNEFDCHLQGGNQKWFYDAKRNLIVHLEYNMCMLVNDANMKVDLAPCDSRNQKMKWSFSSYNKTAINECRAKNS